MQVWVDFENTPHVLILKPIIEELQRRNHSVVITARDCSQTIELAHYFDFEVERVSHHHGKKLIKKILGHAGRISKLVKYVRKKDISIALSHGSRSQIIAAGLLGIPTFVMWDYEYASLAVINRFINRLAVPEVLSADSFDHRINPAKIINYPGIKEDIYVANLMSNGAALNNLTLDQEKVIITIRPPAVEAHYHNEHDKSNELYLEAIEYFSSFSHVIVVVLARTKSQQDEIINFGRKNGKFNNIVFPAKVQNGLTLIWNSDIVVGGGGTMNREAAVLNVPAYSIFQEKLGAVDRYLSETGKLKIIQSKDDLKNIQLTKRRHEKKLPVKEKPELTDYIVEKILETAMKRVKNPA